MVRYTTGNLLDSKADALVNTVNTVGVMGKGIALMFKDAFPDNYRAYRAASKRGEIKLGQMFVTQSSKIDRHQWIINFPTKAHWRQPSRIEWIEAGLVDLKRVIRDSGIKSVALPPLGSGNGGLDWQIVRPRIEEALADLADVDVYVFEPTEAYQNVSKRAGLDKLTPYSILGIECTLLEVQKLAWFIEASIKDRGLRDPLDLKFKANLYGPYADELRHLLDGLDGSYLHADKRIADAGPFDTIRFDDAKQAIVELYLATGEAKLYKSALEETALLIDGFESPLGMELLATIDWLRRHGTATSVEAMEVAIRAWPGGRNAAERKSKIFDRRLVGLALERLTTVVPNPAHYPGHE